MEHRTRVLLVENALNWRVLLSELLSKEGFSAEGFSSYADARGAILRADWDLAIVDLNLSSSVNVNNTDGVFLLPHANQRGIPVIVVSGHASPNMVDELYEKHGVYACLDKADFDQARFLALVRGAVDSRPRVLETPLADRKAALLAMVDRLCSEAREAVEKRESHYLDWLVKIGRSTADEIRASYLRQQSDLRSISAQQDEWKSDIEAAELAESLEAIEERLVSQGSDWVSSFVQPSLS